MTKVEITYGSDTVTMEWDGSNAAAIICIDGEGTQYQTADARHYTENAVRLVCDVMWGQVYETEEDAEKDDRNVGYDNICIWDDVSYETLEEEEEEQSWCVSEADGSD